MTIASRSIGDWELLLGEQVRRLRLAKELDRGQLAGIANVSLGAVKNLECGKGSTLKTMVMVLRALDAEAWLETLSPESTVSPMRMLRDQRLIAPRQRVSRKRTSNV